MGVKLKVLGCSGGIGGRHLRTTSLLVDHDLLIDAGTGVAELSVAELVAIDHVFLTHAHLDHIAALPLMIDTVADRRKAPLTVYGTEPVLEALSRHLFNGVLWPDFTRIPSPDAAVLRYRPIAIGELVEIGGRTLSALPVRHSVPAVGYRLDSGQGSVVFSGDTGSCDAFWHAVNGIANLRGLIVECAFPDSEEALARLAGHLCPSMLAAELDKLERDCEIYVTHLKPGQVEVTIGEIERCLGDYRVRLLENNLILEF